MNSVLKQLETSLVASLDDLDPQQTQLRRLHKPESWSIQQISEHLALTYLLTAQSFRSRIVKGTPTQATPTLKQLLAQLAVTTFGYFPTGRESPEMVAPPFLATPRSGAEIGVKLHQDLAALNDVLDEAESVFGNRRIVTHHVLGPINMTQWRKFHLIHGEHHAKQILAIRRAHSL